MKRIFYIAKNEVYHLFYSPIAWLMMILFLILASVDYIYVMEHFLNLYERGGLNLLETNNLTDIIIAHPFLGYIKRILSNLYMFFPLITMGVISREMSSGTIKLLYSSPVRIRELVLGKYMAMICFIVCLVCLVMVTQIALSSSVANADFGQMAGSLFGLFMVLSAYAAIGVFLSALTSYQIVAAIATFALFAFFSHVGTLLQDVDWVRNITYFLDIGSKTKNLTRGLLNLRDISYLLLIIGGFLSFSIIKIKSAQESISGSKKALRYLAVVALIFILGYITNKPEVNVYADTTRNQLYTITPATQKVLANLDEGELEVTVFANIFFNYFFYFTPETQIWQASEVWGKYIRYKPDIKLKFVYYYDTDTSSYIYKSSPGKSLFEIAKQHTKAYKVDINNFLSPEEVNKLVNTETEDYRCFYQLKYKGKTTILRVFDDPTFFPSEGEVSAALNRLVSTPPRIAFLTDEIERGPFSKRARDLGFFTSRPGQRYSLVNQGFDLDTLSLVEKDIPTDIAALAIVDPRTAFSEKNLEKINSYIDKGGNLFLATEPDRKEITKPLLDKLGLSIRQGLLIGTNTKYSADRVHTGMTNYAINLTPLFERDFKTFAKITNDSLSRIWMQGASTIEYEKKDGFEVVPFLTTHPQLVRNRVEPIDEDSLNLKVAKLPSDEEGKFTTAVRMNRNIGDKEQRIIVASDAEYLTESILKSGGEPKTFNYEFGLNCFSYFSYGKFPANTMRPESKDNTYKILMSETPVQKTFLYWIVPSIIALAGSIILIRRKRK